jgi:3-hydroxyisobutyrate dehydrogenase
MRVGFIGLGVMGTPMAGHLAAAGHQLNLMDLRADHARALATQLGGEAKAFTSASALGAQSEVVFTMLPDGKVVREVCLGENGLLAGMQAGSLVLDTSSAEPWLTLETGAQLAAKGIAMVDAPVSGAAWGAIEANLVFMMGGALHDIERVKPLLALLGRSVFHLGELGSGHRMKCLNNMITALTLCATTEGLLIGKRAGLDPLAMTQVLKASTGQSWICDSQFEKRIFNRAFDDPFKLSLMAKDVGIANALGKEVGASTPMADLGLQLWQQAVAATPVGASLSEMVRWMEQNNATELSTTLRKS